MSDQDTTHTVADGIAGNMRKYQSPAEKKPRRRSTSAAAIEQLVKGQAALSGRVDALEGQSSSDNLKEVEEALVDQAVKLEGQVTDLEARMTQQMTDISAEVKVLSARGHVTPEALAQVKEACAKLKGQVTSLKGRATSLEQRTYAKTPTATEGELAKAQEEIRELKIRVEVLNDGLQDMRERMDAVHLKAQREGGLDHPVTTDLDLGHVIFGIAGMLVYAGAVRGAESLYGKEMAVGGKGLAAAFSAGAMLYEAA